MTEKRHFLEPDGWSKEEQTRIQEIGMQFREEYMNKLLDVPIPLSEDAMILFGNAFIKGFGQGYMFAKTDTQERAQ